MPDPSTRSDQYKSRDAQHTSAEGDLEEHTNNTRPRRRFLLGRLNRLKGRNVVAENTIEPENDPPDRFQNNGVPLYKPSRTPFPTRPSRTLVMSERDLTGRRNVGAAVRNSIMDNMVLSLDQLGDPFSMGGFDLGTPGNHRNQHGHQQPTQATFAHQLDSNVVRGSPAMHLNTIMPMMDEHRHYYDHDHQSRPVSSSQMSILSTSRHNRLLLSRGGSRPTVETESPIQAYDYGGEVDLGVSRGRRSFGLRRSVSDNEITTGSLDADEMYSRLETDFQARQNEIDISLESRDESIQQTQLETNWFLDTEDAAPTPTVPAGPRGVLDAPSFGSPIIASQVFATMESEGAISIFGGSSLNLSFDRPGTSSSRKWKSHQRERQGPPTSKPVVTAVETSRAVTGKTESQRNHSVVSKLSASSLRWPERPTHSFVLSTESTAPPHQTTITISLPEAQEKGPPSTSVYNKASLSQSPIKKIAGSSRTSFFHRVFGGGNHAVSAASNHDHDKLDPTTRLGSPRRNPVLNPMSWSLEDTESGVEKGVETQSISVPGLRPDKLLDQRGEVNDASSLPIPDSASLLNRTHRGFKLQPHSGHVGQLDLSQHGVGVFDVAGVSLGGTGKIPGESPGDGFDRGRGKYEYEITKEPSGCGVNQGRLVSQSFNVDLIQGASTSGYQNADLDNRLLDLSDLEVHLAAGSTAIPSPSYSLPVNKAASPASDSVEPFDLYLDTTTTIRREPANSGVGITPDSPAVVPSHIYTSTDTRRDWPSSLVVDPNSASLSEQATQTNNASYSITIPDSVHPDNIHSQVYSGSWSRPDPNDSTLSSSHPSLHPGCSPHAQESHTPFGYSDTIVPDPCFEPNDSSLDLVSVGCKSLPDFDCPADSDIPQRASEPEHITSFECVDMTSSSSSSPRVTLTQLPSTLPTQPPGTLLKKPSFFRRRKRSTSTDATPPPMPETRASRDADRGQSRPSSQHPRNNHDTPMPMPVPVSNVRSGPAYSAVPSYLSPRRVSASQSRSTSQSSSTGQSQHSTPRKSIGSLTTTPKQSPKQGHTSNSSGNTPESKQQTPARGTPMRTVSVPLNLFVDQSQPIRSVSGSDDPKPESRSRSKPPPLGISGPGLRVETIPMIPVQPPMSPLFPPDYTSLPTNDGTGPIPSQGQIHPPTVTALSSSMLETGSVPRNASGRMYTYVRVETETALDSAGTNDTPGTAGEGTWAPTTSPVDGFDRDMLWNRTVLALRADSPPPQAASSPLAPGHSSVHLDEEEDGDEEFFDAQTASAALSMKETVTYMPDGDLEHVDNCLVDLVEPGILRYTPALAENDNKLPGFPKQYDFDVSEFASAQVGIEMGEGREVGAGLGSRVDDFRGSARHQKAPLDNNPENSDRADADFISDRVSDPQKSSSRFSIGAEDIDYEGGVAISPEHVDSILVHDVDGSLGRSKLVDLEHSNLSSVSEAILGSADHLAGIERSRELDMTGELGLQPKLNDCSPLDGAGVSLSSPEYRQHQQLEDGAGEHTVIPTNHQLHKHIARSSQDKQIGHDETDDIISDAGVEIAPTTSVLPSRSFPTTLKSGVEPSSSPFMPQNVDTADWNAVVMDTFSSFPTEVVSGVRLETDTSNNDRIQYPRSAEQSDHLEHDIINSDPDVISLTIHSNALASIHTAPSDPPTLDKDHDDNPTTVSCLDSNPSNRIASTASVSTPPNSSSRSLAVDITKEGQSYEPDLTAAHVSPIGHIVKTASLGTLSNHETLGLSSALIPSGPSDTNDPASPRFKVRNTHSRNSTPTSSARLDIPQASLSVNGSFDRSTLVITPPPDPPRSATTSVPVPTIITQSKSVPVGQTAENSSYASLPHLDDMNSIATPTNSRNKLPTQNMRGMINLNGLSLSQDDECWIDDTIGLLDSSRPGERIWLRPSDDEGGEQGPDIVEVDDRPDPRIFIEDTHSSSVPLRVIISCEESLIPTEEDVIRAKSIMANDDTVVNPSRAAGWLGDPNPMQSRTRVAFMGLFDFSHASIVTAFRQLCSSVVLRAESQQLDRLIGAFARRWVDCNPRNGFKTVDLVHAITYSILMLNTDLHMADIGSKMTQKQFIRNAMPPLIVEARLGEDETPMTADGGQNLGADLNTGDCDGDSGFYTDKKKKNRLSRLSDREPLSPRNGTSFLDANGDCQLLLDSPYLSCSRNWEGLLEEVLRHIYISIQKERLPLHGGIGSGGVLFSATASAGSLTSLTSPSSASLAVTSSGLRRTPSVLSRTSDAGSVSVRNVGGRWRRPRLPGSGNSSSHGLGSTSRKSIDDDWRSGRGNMRVGSGTDSAIGDDQPLGTIRGFGFVQAIREENESVANGAIATPASATSEILLQTPSEISTAAELAATMASLELAGPPWVKEGSVNYRPHSEKLKIGTSSSLRAAISDRKSKIKSWADTFVVVQRGWLRIFTFSGVPIKTIKRKAKPKDKGKDKSKATEDIASPISPEDPPPSPLTPPSGAIVGGGNWLDSANLVAQFPLQHVAAAALPVPFSPTRTYVWALTLPSGQSHLFHSGTAEVAAEWVWSVNYWAARLSRPPLVGGVSNADYGWNGLELAALAEQDGEINSPDRRLNRVESKDGSSSINGEVTPPSSAVIDRRPPSSVRSFMSDHGFLTRRTHRRMRSGSASASISTSGSVNINHSDQSGSTATLGMTCNRTNSSGNPPTSSGNTPLSGESPISFLNIVSPATLSPKMVVSEWTPPQPSLMESNLPETDQLGSLEEYVRKIEVDLDRHHRLRKHVVSAFGVREGIGSSMRSFGASSFFSSSVVSLSDRSVSNPSSPAYQSPTSASPIGLSMFMRNGSSLSGNGTKAISNWERKCRYLLAETVRFELYVNALTRAGEERVRVAMEAKVEADKVATEKARRSLTEPEIGMATVVL